jgi:hypothetical protein
MVIFRPLFFGWPSQYMLANLYWCYLCIAHYPTSWSSLGKVLYFLGVLNVVNSQSASVAHKGFWPGKWPFELEKVTEMDLPARISRSFHALHQSPSAVFLDQKNNLRIISVLSRKLLAQLSRQRFPNLSMINIFSQVILCLVGAVLWVAGYLPASLASPTRC